MNVINKQNHTYPRFTETLASYPQSIDETLAKSVHYGPKSKAVILHDWCDVLGLYFASSRMWRLSTYFEEGSMLESDSGFP